MSRKPERARPPAPLDVSYLPEYGFGPAMTMFWGQLCFMAIEATGFALAGGAYLYLAVTGRGAWPPGVPPPDLVWATTLTVLLLASVIPNHVLLAKARQEQRRAVRIGLTVMSSAGLLILAVRALEFTTLNTDWQHSAYGSMVWLLIGLHTTHLVTDVVDTLVLNVLMLTPHARGKRFSDVEDNAIYWDFVVVSWLPIYLLIYVFPRIW